MQTNKQTRKQTNKLVNKETNSWLAIHLFCVEDAEKVQPLSQFFTNLDLGVRRVKIKTRTMNLLLEMIENFQ